MKPRTFFALILALVLVAMSGVAAQGQQISPQSPGVEQVAVGTAFTYQGQLKQGGRPVNGTCDMQFRLYDAAAAGNLVAGPISTAVPVAGGLFSVQLDFGPGPFGGGDRWLDIRARCPANVGSYQSLTPRQALTAAPYSLYSRRTPWGGLTDVPAGFADGVDNDTTYSAGFGLELVGNEFRARFGGSGSSATVARADHDHFGDRWSGAAQEGLRVVNTGSTGVSGTGAYYGIYGTSDSYYGVYGDAGNTGVYGHGDTQGVYGQGGTYGVYGRSQVTAGVYGIGPNGVQGAGDAYGVYGSGPTGVYGNGSTNGVEGVGAAHGVTGSGVFGVFGEGSVTGVRGNGTYIGVEGVGTSDTSSGVSGSGHTYGVQGSGPTGVYGAGSTRGVQGDGPTGVYGSGSEYGVYGTTEDGDGVHGVGFIGVKGNSDWVGVGVVGEGTNGSWAGSFIGSVLVSGDINVSGDCYGCAIAYIAQNSGETAIQPGDFVAAAGVQVNPQTKRPMLLVRTAQGAGDVVIGVAAGAMQQFVPPAGAKDVFPTPAFVQRGGVASKGEYLSVLVQGLAQVRVSRGVKVTLGDRLAAGADGAVSTDAAGPALARVLSEPDENGLVWAMVDGR